MRHFGLFQRSVVFSPTSPESSLKNLLHHVSELYVIKAVEFNQLFFSTASEFANVASPIAAIEYEGGPEICAIIPKRRFRILEKRAKWSNVESKRRVRRAKLRRTSWTIQPGQRLATRPELNLMYIEVTRYAKLKERRMISRNASEGFYSPEICLICIGPRVSPSGSQQRCTRYGERICVVPGSQTIAGHSTVHCGTRESHAILNRSLQQAEKARKRYGGMAVGLAHSRGVGGVMPIESPSSLEGASSKTQRSEVVYAIH